MKRNLIKETIKKRFVAKIESWDVKDIYAISFFVYDNEDHPCKPTVSLSYNTEDYVKKNLNYTDELEARWNYAFWPQNVVEQFGYDKESSELIREWINESKLPYQKNYNPYDTTKEERDLLQEITNEFIKILIEVVKEIHNDNILIKKFKGSIPILIHELEYYDIIEKQNVEANGPELVKDFSNYINGLYQQSYDFLEKYQNYNTKE